MSGTASTQQWVHCQCTDGMPHCPLSGSNRQSRDKCAATIASPTLCVCVCVVCVCVCVHTNACLGFRMASAFSILGIWDMQMPSQLQPSPLPSHQTIEETYILPVWWLLTCLSPTHPPLALVVGRGLVFHNDIHQQDGKKNGMSLTFP